MQARLADHLAAHPDLRLPAVAHTLQHARHAFGMRTILVAASVPDAVARPHCPAPAIAGTEPPPVVFMFPGQSAQYPGIARALYDTQDILAQWIDRGATQCAPHLGCNLRGLLCHASTQPGDDDLAARMAQTRIAQPGLFVFEIALARLWISRGVTPAALIGHSVGEFAAAVLGGAMSFEDGLTLVLTRRVLM